MRQDARYFLTMNEEYEILDGNFVNSGNGRIWKSLELVRLSFVRRAAIYANQFAIMRINKSYLGDKKELYEEVSEYIYELYGVKIYEATYNGNSNIVTFLFLGTSNTLFAAEIAGVMNKYGVPEKRYLHHKKDDIYRDDNDNDE